MRKGHSCSSPVCLYSFFWHLRVWIQHGPQEFCKTSTEGGWPILALGSVHRLRVLQSWPSAARADTQCYSPQELTVLWVSSRLKSMGKNNHVTSIEPTCPSPSFKGFISNTDIISYFTITHGLAQEFPWDKHLGILQTILHDSTEHAASHTHQEKNTVSMFIHPDKLSAYTFVTPANWTALTCIPCSFGFWLQRLSLSS